MNHDIERLFIRQACQDLVLRAAACADAGDAQALAQLFAEDAVLQRPSGDALRGRAAIGAAYAQRPAGRLTRHLVTNTLFDFADEDHPGALSQVLLWSCDEAAEPGPHGRPAHARELVGEFDDRFCRAPDGGWLIQRRVARFVMFRDAT
ncbi:nuclear transport factor 2 family protein [Acidovorax sp. CCYZU-2555]|uniref:nuclear transport factor 2 family protein n=1 Tax=Acidovorax sp. CCYZU-2555 TaxID=2835042 RepID=UPI001BCB5204|nr:nuclear transport factor 2 family protein [Acidovorax sp. CCYZU-2555]MBS7781432.1 nuclear transport factor 2 family protein [Acidovorax sp. CCYZU-2555]